MIVLDASAVVAALFDDGPTGAGAKARLERDVLHAPQLVEIEVVHAARRLLRTEQLAPERAEAGIRAIGRLSIRLHGHHPLLDRVWALRDNLSAYDAVYVALAETLGCTLVTTDARMARAPGHRAIVELIA